jgi:hypothetical protein
MFYSIKPIQTKAALLSQAGRHGANLNKKNKLLLWKRIVLLLFLEKYTYNNYDKHPY